MKTPYTHLTINIGLNVANSEPTNQLSLTLALLTKHFTIHNIKIAEGEYQGIKERTLIAQISTSLNPQSVNHNLQEISYRLGQECIAVLNTQTNKGDIIYPKNSTITNKLEFNNGYFITL